MCYFVGLLQVKDSKQAKDVLSTFYSEAVLEVGELPRQLWTDYKLSNRTPPSQTSQTSGYMVMDSRGREVSTMKIIWENGIVAVENKIHVRIHE